MQSYEDVPFSGPKWPISPEQKFFGTNHYYTFIYPLVLFIVQNLKKKKKSYSRSRVMRMHHFWAQYGPFALNKIFFGKNYHFHLAISPFHYAKFLKIFHSGSRSRVMRMRHFWAQNGPFAQMRNFFRKPVNEPCSFHSCLSINQKSKSDIDLLMKY